MTTYTPQQIDLSGAQRLAAAVLAQGVAEALQGSPDAIYWLFTADCAFYANLAGRDNTAPLIGVARRCHPGRRKLHGRVNAAHLAQALAL